MRLWGFTVVGFCGCMRGGYGYGASDILRNGFSSNFSRQSFSSEALGNRHCLNGDFQFRAATRNPENTDNAQNGANYIHWMPHRVRHDDYQPTKDKIPNPNNRKPNNRKTS